MTNLIFTETQTGYWCQYHGENTTLHGLGAFSTDSFEEAELKMWEIIRECERRQSSLSPSIIEYRPKEHILIEPKLNRKRNYANK